MEGSEGKEQERILIPVANPETIEGLVGMALMMRHPKQKESLVALSVINDNNTSETKELIGQAQLGAYGDDCCCCRCVCKDCVAL